MFAEGDHIKITASKYPFPTVCADSQSSDWFKAISRTLKWNERERQKSFVVVEESADGRPKKSKKAKHRDRKTDSTPSAATRVPVGEGKDAKVANLTGEDDDMDEEDEVDDDDEEEEEEKFDIDDSSGDATNNIAQRLAARASADDGTSAATNRVANRGSDEWSADSSEDRIPTSLAQRAAALLGVGGQFENKHTDGGIETPGRFIGSQPRPPSLSPRHVAHDPSSSPGHHHHHHHHEQPPQVTPQLVESPAPDPTPAPAQSPVTALLSPDLRTPRPTDTLKLRPKIPKNPATEGLRAGSHRRGRSMGDTRVSKRTTAFAVYGQDESDSNASD